MVNRENEGVFKQTFSFNKYTGRFLKSNSSPCLMRQGVSPVYSYPRQ